MKKDSEVVRIMHPRFFFVAAVTGTFPWPDENVSLAYEGDSFQLIPPGADGYANVVLELPSGTVPVGREMELLHGFLTTINRFLSALSWSYGESLQAHGITYGPERGKPISGRWLRAQVMPVPSGLWIPEVREPKARRALALMREARAAEFMFPAVAFLWFYKAIEVCVGWRKSETKPFFNGLQASLSTKSLDKYYAWKGLGHPTGKHGPNDTFGDYMRENLRNAIAHGYMDKSLDPDSSCSLRELESEIALVRELAEIAIGRTFKISNFISMRENARASAMPEGWIPVHRLPF